VYSHDAVDIHKPATSLLWRWCVSGRWKLCVPQAVNTAGAAVELYDLVADPHENRNVAAEHSDEVARLQRLIDAWYRPA